MGEHWFEPVAEHLGRAYLRYSHTKGTVQEVDHLVAALGLQPGQQVLDVGCGPGRHAHELARRGIRCHGVDVSARFIVLAREGAPEGATFAQGDARALGYETAFDAAISLCQGGFGMSRDRADDEAVVAGMARALRPEGRMALSAFNAYFAVRYHTAATFDAASGVSHELTEVRDDAGVCRTVDLWTGCSTPRELELLVRACGLEVERISSVEPGAYGDEPPTTQRPELLVIARKPSDRAGAPAHASEA